MIIEEHCYIVCYDLRTPGRNYESLYEALKKYSNWGKLTESCWAITSPNNSSEICKNLLKYIDANDRIFVVLSGKEAAWNNTMATNEWVKANLVK